VDPRQPRWARLIFEERVRELKMIENIRTNPIQRPVVIVKADEMKISL
jgi:hypothetical protein